MTTYATFDRSLSNISFHFNVGVGTTQALSRLHVEGNEVVIGNVGIGTTTPIQPFHLVGLGYVQGNLGIGTTVAGYPLHVDVTSGSDAVYIRQRNVQSDALEVVAPSGGTTLIVKNDGTVGIGTTVAAQKLHVEGTTYISGFLGVGTTTPSYTCHVIGNVYASGTVSQGSDLRFKSDVQPITNALGKISLLQGVSYVRNDYVTPKRELGLIAQDVKEVVPEVVQQGDDGMYSVAYGNMVSVLIEAIKELRSELQELKQSLKQ